MTFDIIATGSSGNAVVLNGNILIDVGVPFKKLEAVKKDLKLVLLTHIHGDHFNPRTVRALAKERPTLRWCCCEWMVAPLVEAGVDKRRIDVLGINEGISYNHALCIETFPLVHDVPNCGWKVFPDEDRIFYATDTGTLDGIEAKNFDLYLIEANHTKEEIEERIKEKHAAGEFAYESRAASNHLSQDQALDWLYQNMGPRSRYVFLHQHKEKERSDAE